MHGGLPAIGIAANFDPHGSSDDLMAEADADDADAVLGENARRVLYESLDPGRVVEGVVSLMGCISQYSRRAGRQIVLDPVIRIASMSFRSG